MESPIVRENCDLLSNCLQITYLNAGIFSKPGEVLDTLPLFRLPLFNLELVCLACLICSLKLSSDLALHLV
jgi:hypothetical protein